MRKALRGAGTHDLSLAAANTFLDSIIENIPDMIFLKDARDLRFIRFNKAGEKLLGYSREEMIGKNDYDFFPRKQADFFTQVDRDVLRSGKVLEIKEEPIQTRQNQIRYLHTKKIPIYDVDGSPKYLLGISEDVTLQKRQAEDLKKVHTELERRVEERTAELTNLISIDPLTGVLNRRGIERELDAITSSLIGGDQTAFALLVDLDNFKEINRVFGFITGDLALKRAAHQITRILRPKDSLGRIGGDEFVVLMPASSEEAALRMAEQVRLSISNVTIGMSSGHTINLSASAGMVVIHRHTASFEELVERSYFSLGQSKSCGKNTVTFKDKQGAERSEVTRILAKMVGGDPSQNKFFAVQQAIHDLQSGALVGYELLSRLDHENYISPTDFFKLAMDARILMLTDHLCLATCLDASLNNIAPGLDLHVNLFPSTIAEIPIHHLLKRFIPHAVTSPICIEISEQQIIGDPSHLIDSVLAIKKAGFKIALDDIGFGSSCLESLIDLEPDIVKIDKSCVGRIHTDKRRIQSLKKIIKIIRSCSAEPYAEGIETLEDLEIIRDLGIRFGQGYYFGEPTPVIPTQMTQSTSR
jgi:diguanylate cyclase (GGDEF)-like protein/PAS domain S-box-containing protein